MKNNKFCVAFTTYNNRPWLTQSINSLRSQSYQNWNCVIVDDCSTDGSQDLIQSLIGGDVRFQFVKNREKKCGLENRIYATTTACTNDEDIVVVLDGDDYLANKKVLEYLNRVYQDDNVWMTYGSYKTTGGGVGVCRLSDSIFHRMHQEEFNLSHLRSYKYWLFKKVQLSDTQDKNGRFYDVAEDIVYLYPMAEMAGVHLRFISKVLYVYNTSSANEYTHKPMQQIKVGYEVRNKIPYMALKDKNDSPGKLSIKLIDSSFPHCSYSATDINGSQYIDWYRGEEGRPYTFYTDARLFEICKKTNNTINIAWILEPIAIYPPAYDFIKNNYYQFDYVLTHSRTLLETLPNAVFVPAVGTWVARKDFKIYPKSKNVSFIVSKQNMTEGHMLRHEIVKKLKDKIEGLYGYAHTPVQQRLDALKDYRYCIVVQNSMEDYYFTEQLLDCFLTGTIPIFWGCPDLGKFFNMNGVIRFNSIPELSSILDNINEYDYLWKSQAIIDNFSKAHEFIIAEDYIYLHFLRKLQAGEFIG